MRTKRIVKTLLLALFADCTVVAGTSLVATSDQPIIMTDRVPVRGIATTTLRMYLGIPYAARAVARLRWRPSKVHERWSTPLNITQFGNHCPPEASVFETASVTEDCLYLNVFRRIRRGHHPRTYPVMVWIHGGALTVGESDDYMPAKLVQQGVIVVTFNYRLGALGSLAHPALSAESTDPIAGNYRIMDQQFALKWV